MNTVASESPTRVDLAGGTLDLWPLHLLVGSSYTINFAIDIYSRVSITPREDRKILLKSKDRGLEKEYSSLEELLACDHEDWLLVRKHIAYWKPSLGFELSTDSESPVGGGLGGSSSLSISLIKAFSQFCDKDLLPHQMVELAGNIEAQVLRTPTGTQDYYPPIFGGLNIIFYGCGGEKSEVFSIPREVFDQRFFLVDTGVAHHSGLNNWSVMKEAIEGNAETLNALQALKEVAEEVRSVCLEKNWEELGPLLKKEFAARIRLCKEVTCPEIEKLEAMALEQGADAVKICGAGGGGCVMVWSPVDRIEKVKSSCRESGFRVLDARIVPPLH